MLNTESLVPPPDSPTEKPLTNLLGPDLHGVDESQQKNSLRDGKHVCVYHLRRTVCTGMLWMKFPQAAEAEKYSSATP